jgi:hypothetical protein
VKLLLADGVHVRVALALLEVLAEALEPALARGVGGELGDLGQLVVLGGEGEAGVLLLVQLLQQHEDVAQDAGRDGEGEGVLGQLAEEGVVVGAGLARLLELGHLALIVAATSSGG